VPKKVGLDSLAVGVPVIVSDVSQYNNFAILISAGMTHLLIN
jgi:hypothetical protein